MSNNQLFFSYSRSDSAFALRLASDLRKEGVAIWIDQLDISPGKKWDVEIENGLHTSSGFIVILSPAAVSSENVMDELSYALEEGKDIIPIFLEKCTIPFRVRRLQYIDFSNDYDKGFKELCSALKLESLQKGEKTINGDSKISLNRWACGIIATVLAFAISGFIFIVNQKQNSVSSNAYFVYLLVASLFASILYGLALKRSSKFRFAISNIAFLVPLVTFTTILAVGYWYRPLVVKNAPFNLTVHLTRPGLAKPEGKLFIRHGSETRGENINWDSSGATFKNLNAKYRADSITLYSEIVGYTVSTKKDTVLFLSDTTPPLINISLIPTIDSFHFNSVVYFLKNGSKMVFHGDVFFPAFGIKVVTDSIGRFSARLPLKTGEKIEIHILKNGELKYSNFINLGNNVPIIF